tara:strand:- start:2528 stop:2860 length:333 start_codon:yes stop_codon:yes gene_type:complete
MSNRTFACLDCRKLQRRSQHTEAFHCPHCGKECIRVHWKLHVPAPSRPKKWDAFWTQYLYELRLLEEFRADKNQLALHLPLLNQTFRRSPAQPERPRLMSLRRGRPAKAQ